MNSNLTIMANALKVAFLPLVLLGSMTWASAQSLDPNTTDNNQDKLEDLVSQIASDPSSNAPAKLPRALETRLLFLALAAEISAGTQSYADASDAYLSAAKIYPDEKFYEKAASYALNAKSIDRVINTSRAWIKAYPQSEVPYLHLTSALISLKQYKASTESYKNAIALADPEKKAGLIREVIRLYALTPEGLNEGPALESILLPYTQQAQTSQATWFVLGALRLENGLWDAAFEALQKLSLQQTDSAEFNYLTFNLLKNNHAPTQIWLEEQLQKNYNSALFRAYYQWQKSNVPTASLLKSLSKLASVPSPSAEVLVYSGELEADNQYWSKAKYNFLKAKNFLGTEKDAKKRQLLNEYLQLKLAEIAIVEKKWNEVMPLLNNVSDASFVEAKLKIEIQFLIASNKIQEGYDLLNSSFLPSTQKNKVWIELLEKQNQFDKALVATDRALQLDNKDAQLLFIKANLLGRLGRTKESVQLHQQLIKKDNKNSLYLNSLGFMLAEKGVELNYAMQLIRTALVISPNNFLYIDSLAWVKFKKGENKEALKLLQQAFAAEPHPEIGAHLGEVLWVMGQKNEALSVWRQSYDPIAPYDVLVKTLERFQQSMP